MPAEQHAGWRGNPKYKGSAGFKAPKPAKGEPPMPYGLSEGARQVWQEVVPSLLRMRVLSVEDGHDLERFCELTAVWRDCRDFVVEHGVSDTTRQGRRKFPEAELMSKYHGDLQRISDRLGLNPSARTRVPVNGEPEPTDDKAGKKRQALMDNFGMVPGEG